ncbi:MAG: HD domain-containing protein, partial [bacterium]|nr:HD domain-containing protein [bacterium]
IDPFGGQKDLKAKVIRAVGNPDERFNEDALRLMRAVRFSAQLGFDIEPETEISIKKHAGLLESIAKERIRDEFSKLLMTDNGHEGVELMRELDLLKYVIPELITGVGVEQNQHHIYSVYEHNLKSLQYAVEKNFPLNLRLAALLHDVGKPKSRQWKDTPNGKKTRAGKRGDWTFYGHQVIGAKQTMAILERLRYSKDIVEHVSLLVYEHMFVYDPEVVTLAGVRRLVSRVGTDNMEALIKLREADRIGSGVPKAQPYRLRYLQAMVEKVKSDPVSAKMLAVNGNDIMKHLDIRPGPILGPIIAILLEEVLDKPEKNQKELLLARVKVLAELPIKELVKISQKSKERAAHEQEKIDAEIKKKYFV